LTKENDMKEIMIIVACLPLYVLNSICDKYISTLSGNRYNYPYNMFKFFLSGLCLLPIFLTDSAPRFTAEVILCGISCGIIYAISKIVTLKGFEESSVAFITFCHSAGMIIPCVIGHFFWSEPIRIPAAIGMILAVFSAVLLKDAPQQKMHYHGLLYGGIVFVTSGGVMICQKLMGLYFFESSISAYNFYAFMVSAMIVGLLMKMKKREEKNATYSIEKIKRKILLCAAGSGISLGMINLVMTKMAGKIPSVILFPLFNGLGVILVCFGSAIVFSEKITPKKAVGLFIGLIGLFLVNL